MVDSHTHTRRFSPDAGQSLSELVRSAEQAGLSGVVVTEHMDPDLDLGLMIFDVDEYFQVMDAFRQDEHPRIRVLNGIEAGYMPHLAKRYRKLVASHPFDLVIGSVHALDGDDIYFRQDVFAQGREAAYGLYLDQLIDMVRNGDWLDVVGHYDYVCRVSGYPAPRLLYREQSDRFDTLFRLMIENGKSLEINARTIRSLKQLGEPDPFPDRDIYARYRELGGELVTLGSDSHRPEETALYFKEMQAFLSDIGFDRAFTFINREPVPVS